MPAILIRVPGALLQGGYKASNGRGLNDVRYLW
jgi:hypothetical protein